MTPRFIILNSMLVALVALLAMGGYLDQAIVGGNWIGIAAVGVALLLGLFAVAKRNLRHARFITTNIPRIGLCGTVYGFVLAFSSIEPGQAADAQVANLIFGMGIALCVTLAGSVSNLWLHLNMHLLGMNDG